jgi:hypothetical protein
MTDWAGVIGDWTLTALRLKGRSRSRPVRCERTGSGLRLGRGKRRLNAGVPSLNALVLPRLSVVYFTLWRGQAGSGRGRGSLSGTWGERGHRVLPARAIRPGSILRGRKRRRAIPSVSCNGLRIRCGHGSGLWMRRAFPLLARFRPRSHARGSDRCRDLQALLTQRAGIPD